MEHEIRVLFDNFDFYFLLLISIKSNKMLTKFYTSLQNLIHSPMEKDFFETTQQYFRILGINLKQNEQSAHKYPLFLRNVRTFFVFGSGTIASICYTVTSAKTFEEYIATFYVLSSMLICFSIYTIVVWTMDQFIRFFNDVNEIMQERKLNIYIKSNI